MLQDISTRTDIELLVNKFYEKALRDELIGYFFTEVIELNWDHHIPLICDFWETTLLGSMNYKGNPMVKHMELNKKERLKQEHFERWLNLWELTINENFSGQKADEAVQRAKQIAMVMQHKIGGSY